MGFMGFMRKFLVFILFFGLFVSVTHARRGFKELRDTSVVTKLHWDNIAISSNVVLVDLSDTSNYKHKQTGSLNISDIRIGIDKPAASTGTISIGIVFAVSATSGSIRYFYHKRFENDIVGTHLYETFQPLTGLLRTELASDNTFKYMVSNITSIDNTDFQTDVPLVAASGTHVLPAIGDLIMSLTFDTVGAAIDVDAEVVYHAVRP